MDDRQWWKEAVVYQIYPQSFQDTTGSGTGDLQGITERLDYLKNLGVDVIWLSPIFESPGVDNGYDISDYRAINPRYGSMADFDRLLTEAHRRGIKLILDLVVNHTSDRHPWFAESRSSRDNPKRDWYIWRDGFNGGPPNELRSVFSGSAWRKDEITGQYYLHLFTIEQPDLNWANPEVRNAVYDMMRYWLDKGIDGFRMDVIDAICKPESALAVSGGAAESPFGYAGVHEYLREMNEKVLSRCDIMTVGETSSATVESALLFAGRESRELNMVFQFEHMFFDQDRQFGKWLTKKFDLPGLKKILDKWQTGLYGKAWNSLYWNNHDQPRVVSHFGCDADEQSRVLSAKMLGLCLHMMQGSPYIYQGEELGMTNTPLKSLEDCRDVEVFNAYRELVEEKKLLSHEQMMAGIQKSSRDNARTPMQWDGTKNAGFSAGTPWIPVNPNYRTINAALQVQDPDSVWSFYRRLIKLRKEIPVIVYGDFEDMLPDDRRVYAYRRRLEGKSLLAICNFSGEEVSDLDLDALGAGKGELLIANYDAETLDTTRLRPYEGRAYLVR
ncbi:MAG: alpha-glucosidase [Treponema sp.]|nr:alpha-glucosidase [Treponema sp.]